MHRLKEAPNYTTVPYHSADVNVSIVSILTLHYIAKYKTRNDKHQYILKYADAHHKNDT